MIVTCSNCQARYAVDPLAIGPAGRTVQCARCDHRWFQRVEGPRPPPDMVIRPQAPGASLPVVIEPKPKLPWGRYAAIAGAAIAVIVLAGVLYFYRDQITGLISNEASASRSAPAAAPAATPARAAPSSASASTSAAPKPTAEGPHLEVDLNASKVELVDGHYVVHGDIVNSGNAAATTKALKFTFKKNNDVVGERSYPQNLGPIAPGARMSFSQVLDEPPAGTTDIVPAVE